MAFSFIVEDGTGLPNATSYVSVDDADDILITNIHNTAWIALDIEQKEYLLSWATRLIDTKAEWYGTKSYPSSALRWPRRGTVDRDGVIVAYDEIPLQLKQAVAEYANSLIASDRTSEQETDGITEIVVDVIEIKFDSSYRLSTVPSLINDLIIGLGRIKGGRTTIAKILRS